MIEGLRLLLIDRLRSLGMDPLLIPAYLRALTSFILSQPNIDPDRANQKINSPGWNDVAIDYHSLQITIACLEQENSKV